VESVFKASILTDYEDAHVFGGGTGTSDGQCFDTIACFTGALVIGDVVRSHEGPGRCMADPLRVMIAAPPPLADSLRQGDVNVAVVTNGDGICGSEACYVPLDRSTPGGILSGWEPAGEGRIHVPEAVCDREKHTGTSRVLGLAISAVSPQCPSKHPGIPTCGAWSSVGAAQSGISEDPSAPPSGR
jgi:hypothetical protein